jgi:parvulin-like peptidyl-prolyl isomerase
MTSASLLALALAATAPEAPSVLVLLKASAASAPRCRTAPADGGLVQANLFAPESAECPVAIVGDDTIRLRELAASVDSGHLARERRPGGAPQRPAMDFAAVLDRLVATRLIAQEAREMQLDQAPELRADLERHRASRLREMVSDVAVRGVKPDTAEVERLYREAVREWKIASVLVDKEEDAKAFVAALRSGASFEALAKKAAADKKGRGDGKSQWVSRKHMLPEILAAVQGAKVGGAVDPVKISSGFVVLRVDSVRYPKDEAARADARAQSLARKQSEAIRGFYKSLKKKYAVVDEALLAGLDFEKGGEKGFEELSKDQRVLVKIKGDKPITVADLTEEVGSKFFHGMKGPIEEQRVNRQKAEAFERLLGARLFAREAAVRKLETRPEYLQEVEAYERVLLFGDFITKVILPEAKVEEGEARAYYEQHKGEFTGPQMYKLDGFAFAAPADAQGALDKLKAGTDFTWLRNTASGQVPPERRSLQFDGRTVSASTLQPELASALTNARAGEYRLWAAREAEVYVLRVVEQTPPQAQPYDSVRDGIEKKLREQKIARALDDYAARLRKAQPVEVLLARGTP